MKGIILALLLCTRILADNRPVFSVEYGQEEWWGFAVGTEYFEGKVWQDFDELDSHIAVVCWADKFYEMAEGHEWDCVVILAANPKWRGSHGDKVQVKWNADGWRQGGNPDFEVLHLRTKRR